MTDEWLLIECKFVVKKDIDLFNDKNVVLIISCMIWHFQKVWLNHDAAFTTGKTL